MLMIDVDFFKGYNDDYGHAAGDACLCRIGEVLELTLRRGGDIVARYGGEEFVALLPHASRESAADLAERLRSGVQALAIPHRGAAAGAGVVTISVGVAHAREIIADDPAELLALADRALYIAKERRNTVVIETREASVAGSGQTRTRPMAPSAIV
jgi:diguanylate cyclase (GGDEF)-like protein